MSAERTGLRPPSGIPARGYSWPPFAKGHEINLRHGAYTPRKYGPVAEQIVTELLAGADYLRADKYRPAVEALGVTEARLRLLDEWLAKHGILDAKGKPQPAVDLALKMERLAIEQRSQLGLTPSSAAKLGRNIAGASVDLARLMADDAAAEAEEASDA